MNFIYKTIPLHTAEGVPADQRLEIYFMIDIDISSFKQENIVLLNMSEQIVEPVQIKYNRRMLNVVPVNKLKPNSHYQLSLVGGEKGIKDITGRTMVETKELEFTTKETDSIKPPILLSPVDKSVLKEAATFIFNPVENAYYYELQISKSNIFQNLIWPTEGEKIYNLDKMVVTPDITYETGAYYARVRSVNEDGDTSSWSTFVRYYFDNEPVIDVAPEEPFPGTKPEPEIPQVTEPEIEEEPKIEEEPTPELEPSTMSAKGIVRLQSKSKIVSNQTQLTKLKQIFSVKAEEKVSSLLVKSSTPIDGQVNNTILKLNVGKEFVVEFTDNLDANSVNDRTCYVLAERN